MNIQKKVSGKIYTVIKAETHEFLYEYWIRFDKTFKHQSFMFEIWKEGMEGDFKFSFILIILENSADLKVTDMHASIEYFKGKGIARAMILEAKRIFNKRLISSSNSHPLDPHEMRRPNATRVWEKMVEEGLADYNREEDYFFTL